MIEESRNWVFPQVFRHG